MRAVTQRLKRRNKNFNFCAKRRTEIEALARHVGAGDTDDFDRYLIAWVWHNPDGTDQAWSLAQAAIRMRGKITPAQADAILEEADATPEARSAADLGEYLGLTQAVRDKLGITTIRATIRGKAMGDRTMKELRKRKDRLAKGAKRREQGARPQSQSLSQTEPWRELGMSRRTYERKGYNKRDAISSAAFLLNGEDELAATPQGRPSEPSARREGRGLACSRTATLGRFDVHGSLPIELRLAALCLPLPDEMRLAA